jgi:hypothetical protein
MFYRPLASLSALIFATSLCSAQDAVVNDLIRRSPAAPPKMESAWLDLRQVPAGNSNPQSAPEWVESVTIIPAESKDGSTPMSVFRIRMARPNPDSQMLFFRLFFDDKPDQKPQLVVWDESGTQVLQSGQIGQGLGLPTSETVIIPMVSVSTIDIEVPGDGKSIRGAYLDWMTRSEVMHPSGAAQRDLIPEPFAAMAPLHSPEQDKESFGTVTATLANETIPIGSNVSEGAAFEFGIETQPLIALITFEVANPAIDRLPEIYVNGENIGTVTLVLPDLGDPGYRGENSALLRQMRFHYTGWLRAQKLLPASSFRIGTNDILIVNGPNAAGSAVRGTQVQLKYLWEKSDYELQVDTGNKQ